MARLTATVLDADSVTQIIATVVQKEKQQQGAKEGAGMKGRRKRAAPPNAKRFRNAIVALAAMWVRIRHG